MNLKPEVLGLCLLAGTLACGDSAGPSGGSGDVSGGSNANETSGDSTGHGTSSGSEESANGVSTSTGVDASTSPDSSTSGNPTTAGSASGSDDSRTGGSVGDDAETGSGDASSTTSGGDGSSETGSESEGEGIASCILIQGLLMVVTCTEYEGADAAEIVEETCVSMIELLVAEPHTGPCSREDALGRCETISDDLTTRTIYYESGDALDPDTAENICTGNDGTWMMYEGASAV